MNDLVKDIVKSVFSNKDEILIRNFEFKHNKRNELLFFFKPECFLVKNADFTKSIIEMVLNKFRQYDVDISGVLQMNGKRLEELSIMDRHYGFINKLSRNASKMISEEELSKIKESLGIKNLEEYKIFGGHEFLLKYDKFNERSLDNLWSSKKAEKLRSGYYVQKYTIDDDNIILIDGFHPSQLRHFTDPSHIIIILLLHSNTFWKNLKNNFVGNTFPENAENNSIRSELFKNSKIYGIEEVNITNNCVHLSAGPFEALFETDNFLKNIQNIDFYLDKTNMFRLMGERGIRKENIEKCIQNPIAQINGKPSDLFTLTEDKDSLDAITCYSQYFIDN